MLAVENRSMSSSRGFVDLAADAIALLEMIPSETRVLLSAGFEGSSSKSSRFSAWLPATTVCRAFSREASSSGLPVNFVSTVYNATYSTVRFAISSAPSRPLPMKVAAGLWYTLASDDISLNNSSRIAGATVV